MNKKSNFLELIRLMRYSEFRFKIDYVLVIIKILFNPLSEYYLINFSSFNNGIIFLFDFINGLMAHELFEQMSFVKFKYLKHFFFLVLIHKYQYNFVFHLFHFHLRLVLALYQKYMEICQTYTFSLFFSTVQILLENVSISLFDLKRLL